MSNERIDSAMDDLEALLDALPYEERTEYLLARFAQRDPSSWAVVASGYRHAQARAWDEGRAAGAAEVVDQYVADLYAESRAAVPVNPYR